MITSLHIIGSQAMGGAESFFIRLVTALHNEGHTVNVICKPNSGVAKALQKTGITCHFVNLGGKLDLLSYLRVSRIIRTIKPDVVQSYMSKATRFASFNKAKSSVYVSRLGGFYKLRSFYEKYDAWIGNTQSIRTFLIDNCFTQSRVHHIPNFVEPATPSKQEVIAEFRREKNIPENALTVIALGRFVEKKGMDFFLNSVTNLPPEINGRPVYSIVLGDGPLQSKLHEQAHKLGISDRVVWAGWQSDIWPWLECANLFVCPSRHEPLGNVIMEAWAAKKPVISTNTHGGMELIQDEQNGRLVDIDNEPALTAAMLEVLSSPNESDRIAQAGFNTMMQKFSKESVTQTYLALYQELIDEKKISSSMPHRPTRQFL